MKNKMKLLIVLGIALPLICFVGYSQVHKDEVKAKTELVVAKTAPTSLEIKEAYKLDNAEYKSAVSTPTSFSVSGVSFFSGYLWKVMAVLGMVYVLRKFLKTVDTKRLIAGMLIITGLLAVSHYTNAGIETGLIVANAIPIIKFNKEGLSGDNLKLVEELEKRMTGLEVPEKVKKDLAIAIVKDEIEVRMKKFEGVDEKIIQFLKEAANEGETGIRSILLKQGEEITKLKKGEGKPEPLDVRSQVKKWQEENKDALARIKSGSKADLSPLEVRVVLSPMTPANALDQTNGRIVREENQTGIIDLIRVVPTLWNTMTKGRTNAAAYTWVNKTTAEGAADWISAGTAKPGVSFKLEKEVSNAKKIAVSDKVATELLEDVDGMTTYIEQELQYLLDNETNDKLMTGVASASDPDGLQTISVPFSATGLSVVDPNNMDCIRSGVAQLRSGNFPANLPITVFINPIDAANMDMQKSNAMGVYVLPPFSTSDGRTIAGATIIEDNNVEVGNVQFAILSLFKCLIYKDMTIATGWENDDFTKNLITTIAERRVHSFHSENHDGAFIYDSFANIKTAIEAM